MGFTVPLVQFVVGVGAGTGAGATIAAVARFVALTAGSALLSKALQPKGAGIASRNVTSRGTVDAQAIVYGEAVTSGTLAYRNVHGVQNSELWAVHCLCGHQVDSITDVYLDDDLITDAQINGGAVGGGAVGSGTYGPTSGGTNVVEIWKKRGLSSQTSQSDLAAASADWDSTHRLRGIAYIATMFKLTSRTEDIWEAGDPTNVRAKVRGKLIYDPRLDSTQVIDATTSPETYGSGSHRADDDTTWEWSDNPALCVADYLRDSKFSPLAGGIDSSRIDWGAVATAADHCDELVAIPPAASPENTEKRFTCNGVIYGTAAPEENLQALLSSMNGSLDFVQGIYVIRAGMYVAPSDTLDEKDVIGPVGVKTALDSDERVNTIKAAFINPDKLYQADETADLSYSAYLDTRDGGTPLPKSIQLPMTDSNTMAQRIGLKRLLEANQELTLTVPCNLRALRLVPGERVSLTVSGRWSSETFKVLDWELFDRGADQVGVNVTLKIDSASAYTDPDVSDYNTYTNGTLTKATPIPRTYNLPNYLPNRFSTFETANGSNFSFSGSFFSASAEVDASVRFLGSKSLKLTMPTDMAGEAALRIGNAGMVRVPPGRTWAVAARYNPDAAAAVAAGTVRWLLAPYLDGGATSLFATQYTMDNLTAGAWTELTAILDADGETETQYSLLVLFRLNSGITSPESVGTLNIDELALYDVTDITLIEGDL